MNLKQSTKKKRFNELQKSIIQEQKHFIDKHIRRHEVKEVSARTDEMLRQLDEQKYDDLNRKDKGMKRRECVFCSDTNLSREHVFPQWLLDELGIRKKQMDMRHHSFLYGKISDRHLTLNNLINGLVCEGCNNGWMSQLENNVKPILQGLIGNKVQERALQHLFDNKELVSKWVFKTSIMLNHASNYRNIVPRRHFRYFYKHRRIPKNVCVLLGITKDIKEELDWIQSPLVMHLRDKKEQDVHKRPRFGDLYKITLKIDKIMLKVIYSPFYDYEYFLEANDHIMIHPNLLRPNNYEFSESLLKFDIDGSIYQQKNYSSNV